MMTHYEKTLQAAGFTEFHKEVLQSYYEDGKDYLLDAGVPKENVESDKSIGCLARYILDTYNLNGNAVDLSPFFFRRLKQLQMKGVGADEEEPASESV